MHIGYILSMAIFPIKRAEKKQQRLYGLPSLKYLPLGITQTILLTSDKKDSLRSRKGI